MAKYFLGIDGGNSKTDYLLTTLDGDFVDVYRTPTCSHEAFKTGYDGMEEAMREQVDGLFERNKIGFADIAATGMGLAGADLPAQYAELYKRCEKIGFPKGKYVLANDGIMGVKGACDSGVGVCAINGAGTVVLGIDEKGDILQVGGVGPLSGDYAGGVYIMRQIVGTLYDFYYRCGDDSSMFQDLLTLLDIKPKDLLTAVGDWRNLNKNNTTIIQLGDKAACGGDAVAKRIFDTVGFNIGRNVAGCIKNLSFAGMGTADNPIDIVLAGSIWHKVEYAGLKGTFERTIREMSGKNIRLISLLAPPAVGGVLWAKEIYDGAPVPVEYRRKILETINLEKYESWVYEEVKN